MNFADTRGQRSLILMADKHIGNLVVSLPALCALQAHYKDRPHLFLIDAGFRDLVETLIAPENILFYERSRIRKGNPVSRARAYFSLLRALKSFQADLLIDLVGSRNSGMLAKASGASRRLAKTSASRPSLYTDLIELNDHSHKVFDYTDIAAAAGAHIDPALFRYEPHPDKLSSVQQRLHEQGIDPGRPLISIHIGAGRIQKLWNIAGYIAVTQWLAENGCQVVFLGAADESHRARQVIAGLSQPVLNLVGEISLGEVLGLLKLSTAYLGNDSGPMHMAAAMGTPGVAMFSYARESEWGPRSEQFTVLRGQDICKVCIRKACRDPVCITTLPSASVIRELAAILQISS